MFPNLNKRNAPSLRARRFLLLRVLLIYTCWGCVGGCFKKYWWQRSREEIALPLMNSQRSSPCEKKLRHEAERALCACVHIHTYMYMRENGSPMYTRESCPQLPLILASTLYSRTPSSSSSYAGCFFFCYYSLHILFIFPSAWLFVEPANFQHPLKLITIVLLFLQRSAGTSRVWVENALHIQPFIIHPRTKLQFLVYRSNNGPGGPTPSPLSSIHAASLQRTHAWWVRAALSKISRRSEFYFLRRRKVRDVTLGELRICIGMAANDQRRGRLWLDVLNVTTHKNKEFLYCTAINPLTSRSIFFIFLQQNIWIYNFEKFILFCSDKIDQNFL